MNCSVCSHELNSVVVTTPPTSDLELNKLLEISVFLNEGSLLVASQKFVYRRNPSCRNIEPRNHLIVCVLYDSNKKFTK